MNRFLSDMAILIVFIALCLFFEGDMKIAMVVGAILQAIAIMWTYAPTKAA